MQHMMQTANDLDCRQLGDETLGEAFSISVSDLQPACRYGSAATLLSITLHHIIICMHLVRVLLRLLDSFYS